MTNPHNDPGRVRTPLSAAKRLAVLGGALLLLGLAAGLLSVLSSGGEGCGAAFYRTGQSDLDREIDSMRIDAGVPPAEDDCGGVRSTARTVSLALVVAGAAGLAGGWAASERRADSARLRAGTPDRTGVQQGRQRGARHDPPPAGQLGTSANGTHSTRSDSQSSTGSPMRSAPSVVKTWCWLSLMPGVGWTVISGFIGPGRQPVSSSTSRAADRSPSRRSASACCVATRPGWT